MKQNRIVNSQEKSRKKNSYTKMKEKSNAQKKNQLKERQIYTFTIHHQRMDYREEFYSMEMRFKYARRFHFFTHSVAQNAMSEPLTFVFVLTRIISLHVFMFFCKKNEYFFSPQSADNYNKWALRARLGQSASYPPCTRHLERNVNPLIVFILFCFACLSESKRVQTLFIRL